VTLNTSPAAGEIDCVVIRPGDVYGPGSRPWTVLPLEAIRSNRFALPRMGRGVFSPLYIDNLLDALLLAIEAPAAAGEVFNVTDGAGISCREFFGRYYEMLGKSGPPVLPTAAAMGLVTLNEVGSRVAAVNTEVNRISMRYLAREGTYSIEKARRLLGYEPKVGLDEGMAATEAWLQEHGLLRGRVAA
jgi:nucleoside-diphosphate-sugar epimerase